MLHELKNIASFNNLKNNILFFLSGICFSLLVLQFEPVWFGVFVIVFAFCLCMSLCTESMYKQFRHSDKTIKVASLVSSTLLGFACIIKFVQTWSMSGMIVRIAAKISLSNTAFLSIMGSALAMLSFFFLTLAFNIAFTELNSIIKTSAPFPNLKSSFANIRRNTVFILSAFTFMGMNIHFNKSGMVSLLLSCVFIVLLFSQVSGITSKIKEMSLLTKIYSLISSIGICVFSRESLILNLSPSSFYDMLCEKAGLSSIEFLKRFSVFSAIFACVAVFLFVSMLLKFVSDRILPVVKSLSKTEIAVYSLIIVGLFAFVTYSFTKSNAFWGTAFRCDLIYTSDSPMLVKENAFLNIFQFQNDLRQPLFAVFAAPFIGFGYMLSIPLSVLNPVFTPLFMNFVQIAMLLTANVILSKMLNLRPIEDICFMLITSVTYTMLLSCVMMEQYIVGYFWLILAIYGYAENKKMSKLSFCASSGALLTNLIIFPLTLSMHENKNYNLRKLITDLEKTALCFIFIFFTSGRFDIIYGFSENTALLSKFAGGKSLFERVFQFLSFVSSCFVAPNAYIKNDLPVSWQLSNSISLSSLIIGITVLVLCVAGFIVGRKQFLTRISACWVVFSALLLCVVGWGSVENGMILYSLYFCWAYIVLIFTFIKWLGEKIKLKSFTPAVSCILLVLLGLLNYRGICDLLNFAFTYYPF